MDTPAFAAIEWGNIKGFGRVAYVACDRERPRDGSDLRERVVLIDGVAFRCVGVERKALADSIPIAPGEKIGLMIVDPPAPLTQDAGTDRHVLVTEKAGSADEWATFHATPTGLIVIVADEQALDSYNAIVEAETELSMEDTLKLRDMLNRAYPPPTQPAG